MKRFIISLTMLMAIVAGAWADDEYQYDQGLYNTSFMMYVSLTDEAGTIKTASDLGSGTYTMYAFIGNECRGAATMEATGGNLFQLRVWGNPSDNGKEITLRVLVDNSVFTDEVLVSYQKMEYRIPSKNDVHFVEDGTLLIEEKKCEPSNPYKVKFVPATTISMPLGPITVHYGDKLDMMELLTTEPENALIPYPHDWGGTGDEIQIVNDTLKAVGVTNVPGLIMLTVGEAYPAESAIPIALTFITVDNPAVNFEWADPSVTKDANDGSKGSVTIDIDDANTLLGLLGSGYTQIGKDANSDATTTYTWNSSNTDVISFEPTGGLNINSVGSVTLTGVPDDGTTFTSPQLTVTVVKTIKDFTYDTNHKSDTILVLQVGDNLTQRIQGILNVEPADATNKIWNLEVKSEEFLQKQGTDFIAVKATSDIGDMKQEDDYYKVNADEKGDRVTICAADFKGFTKNISVIVIPQQPTALGYVANPLSVIEPKSFPSDISEFVYGNVTLTRNSEGMNAKDFLNRIEWGSQDEKTITINQTKVPSAISLIQKKDAVITASLTTLDNGDTQVDIVNRTVSIKKVSLSADLNVTIASGLSGFKIADVKAKVGETVEITLVPQPDGLSADMVEADKISVSVAPTVDLPTSWGDFATASVKEGDNTGLTWNVTASSVGNAKIGVKYDGNDQVITGGNLLVEQSLALKSGWQWISLYEGQMSSKEVMVSNFGDDLEQIRSKDAIVYNDPVYGYFGALTTLEGLQTYKVYMKNKKDVTVPGDFSTSTYFSNNNVDPTNATPLSIVARKGWNWIGNPYQYSHNLSEGLFGTTKFSDDDMIKGKENFAIYNNGAWTGDLTSLEPGQGYMFFIANGGQVDFAREFSLSKPTEEPAGARTQDLSPWKIDHSRFIDNMSMIARVDGISDASHLTLYAFRNGECRGRGVAVGDLQFITVHGESGERFTFAAYDELTGQYYEISGSRAFSSVSGSLKAPVSLSVGETTSVEIILNKAAMSDEMYDLQGRRVNNAQLKKGIYVQQGRKVIK